MSWSAIRVAVIVLEVIGILLLSALLVTPAHKHAIVNAIIGAALLRNISAVVPLFAYEALWEQFNQIQQHPTLSHFCGIFGILLRYLTVVKAAFAVSFTLPLLYLALKNARNAEGAPRGSPFNKRTVVALCVTPFLWALPTVFIPLRRLGALSPQFHQAVCIISDPAYQFVSLSLMIAPLVLASFISLIFVWVLWRSVKLPLFSHSLGILDATRILRFGALLAIIVLSAILYAVVMATWAQGNDDPGRVFPMDTTFAVSVVWEAITPIMMFFIFGAHEEVFEVWTSWYYHIPKPLPTELPTSGRGSPESLSVAKPPPTQPKRFSRVRESILAIKSEIHTSGGDLESGLPLDVSRKRRSLRRSGDPRPVPPLHTLPRKILLRPLSSGLPSLTHTPQASTDTGTTISLPPPPRPARSRSASPDVNQTLNQVVANLTPVTPPPCDESGDTVQALPRSQNSCVRETEGGHGSGSSSHLTTEGSRRPMTGSSSRRPDTAQSRRPDTAQSRRPDTAQSRRPDTAQSSRTFGTFGTLGTLGR